MRFKSPCDWKIKEMWETLEEIWVYEVDRQGSSSLCLGTLIRLVHKVQEIYNKTVMQGLY